MDKKESMDQNESFLKFANDQTNRREREIFGRSTLIQAPLPKLLYDTSFGIDGVCRIPGNLDITFATSIAQIKNSTGKSHYYVSAFKRPITDDPKGYAAIIVMDENGIIEKNGK